MKKSDIIFTIKLGLAVYGLLGGMFLYWLFFGYAL